MDKYTTRLKKSEKCCVWDQAAGPQAPAPHNWRDQIATLLESNIYLLAALSRLVDMRDNGMGIHSTAAWSAAYKQARAAITKAQVESH